MSLFSGPEEHAANPPETWTAVKAGDRCWQLTAANGTVMSIHATRKAAEADRESGPYATLYRKLARWYAGENIYPWKPWAQVKAEQERHAAWLESRKVSAASR